MMYLRVAFLCLAIVPGSFSTEDIHSFMTPEEVQQIFHTDHDSVPNYEITKLEVPEKFHKRDAEEGRKMHITAFGEDIELWLHPTNPVLAGEETPVYYAKHAPGHPENVEFRRVDGLMKMVGRIFEDPYWRASFVIGREESGSSKVNGYIGSKQLVVRSLPARVAEEYRRRTSSEEEAGENSYLHVVFQAANYGEELSIRSINETVLQERVAQSNDGIIPDTLYPEVLAIVEHSVSRTYGDDIYGLLEYVLAFYNGVDLKYRSIQVPKIRFHIAAFVIAKDSLATPYISNNSLDVDVFNTHQALADTTRFLWTVRDTFDPNTYDIAVTMTTQAFGVNGSEAILGQAWVAFACKRDAEAGTVNSVTTIRDDLTFGGVHVAAHEIGHLLGSYHDLDKDDDCLYSNGFIMSFTPWWTKNSSDFSSCSLDQFSKTLQNNKLDCLFNVPPSTGKTIPELMPGRVKNLDKQCESAGRNASCQAPPNVDMCVDIYCLDEYDRCLGSGMAAADGTPCGDNKFCLHMSCVSL